ncbi:ABC transporter ATP-binding protein [Biomaibacter acetigenes]|uniref:ABC transporter ATP-binding protein n=1 Tax=Biomaibacter acetigenes TaxID=2316383 RepID=A0A3G2R432_9FIRM|nr:ABC transporter ATP-binding protein [Biomaibacter acetigenes]AYO30152.1 ABC transporter ATP-binding protein [Biomaibacter acetigenes]
MINNKESVVKLKNVTHIYPMGNGEIRALQDITLDIDDDDYLAVIGHSGSGKSTLLRMIGALEIPTQGEVYMEGFNTCDIGQEDLVSLRAKTVGFVFQDFRLLPQLTALENVMVPLLPYEKYNSARKKAMELMERVGLSNRVSHRPGELSGGEQQRVAIARALIRNPKVLLADELTGNLDTATRDSIMELLDELNCQGLAVVVATHDQEVMAHAKRRIRLRDGAII